jgi:hypothetical protein
MLLPLLLKTGCQSIETRESTDCFYERGMWCTACLTDFDRARLAVIVTITELKMPLYQEGPLHHGGFIDTRTPDGYPVRIEIRGPRRHEGEISRIGIRVGGFGSHREVCERLHREIAHRLDQGAELSMPVQTGGVPTSMPPSSATAHPFHHSPCR